MAHAPVTIGDSRRRFIQTLFTTTVFGGAAWSHCLGQVIGKLAPTPSTGLVRLKLAEFTDLQTTNGSILINVPGTGGSIEPLIVTRVAGNKVYAVSSTCTHSGCLVNTYDASSGGLRCPCHGSVFSPSGGVVRGPAGRSLRSFKATLEGDVNVAIEIPGVAYVINGSLVTTQSGSARFKLTRAKKTKTQL